MAAARPAVTLDPAFLHGPTVDRATPWRPATHWWLGASSLLVATVALWLGPGAADPEPVRPALAVIAVLFAAACMAVTAAYTEGRERIGWGLLLLGTLGAMLPVIGSFAGITFAAGLVVVAGAGFRDDRHRLLDATIALGIVGTAAAAYLFPAMADLEGVERFDGYVGATQVVLALGALVFVTYRCRPSGRPDVWLLAGGFLLGTATGMPSLVDPAENHATTWVPAKGWEVGLAIGALLVGLGARLRLQRPERTLSESGHGSRTSHALAGELSLAALIAAFVIEHPGDHTITLPLLAATLVVRHLRSREVVRDNENLAEAASRETERRLELYRASFVALATAIEARDGYTGRHSEETVALAEAVGTELGLGPRELSELKTVALLHDVGKIGIPDSILHKQGELDEEEWRIMRRHPVIGERILCGVPDLQGVARAVRHEHERWDGGGYPDGIAGEAIPLASRIVLVCDAWHAMTSDRPYRARMSGADALAELRRCAGSHFDPLVVEALVRAVGSR